MKKYEKNVQKNYTKNNRDPFFLIERLAKKLYKDDYDLDHIFLLLLLQNYHLNQCLTGAIS